MEKRTYNADTLRYKFTGKEKDKDLESNYDYFPACSTAWRGGRQVGTQDIMIRA